MKPTIAEAESTAAHFPVPHTSAEVAHARRRALDAIKEAEAALVNLHAVRGRLLLVEVDGRTLVVGSIPAWRRASLPYKAEVIDVPVDLWKRWVEQARGGL
jgi:hypothetical protein